MIKIIMLSILLTTMPSISVSLRNPFAPIKKKKKQKKATKTKQKKKKKKSLQLKLIGTITNSDSIGAIVKHNKEQKILFTNDMVNGYQVYSITPESLLLKKGEKTKTLSMSKKRKSK